MGSRRWCYVIGRNLYVHLTSRANSITLLGSRGPLLQWPQWLQDVRDTQDAMGPLTMPEPQSILEEVRGMVAEAADSEAAFESIVFAGDGEPTLAMETLVEVGQSLHGLLPLRLNTNGLGSLEHNRNIVPELGFLTGVSILLNACNGPDYGLVMRPRICGSPTKATFAFDAATTFLRDCAAAGMEVEVTAVEMPGVDIEAVRRFVVEELGMSSFRSRSFHPLPETSPDPGTMHAAAICGDTAALRSAVDSAPNGPDERDAVGNTALVWAADRGHSDCVEMMLSARADVNARGLVGNSALHRAARNGHVEIASRLIANGAVPGRYNGKLQTEMHIAAFYKHLPVVRVLLEAGANPSLLDRKGRSPAEDTSSEQIRAEILKAQKAQ
eukprot:gnl/TRDRNA2_/TRDRNA2_39252_c0_seq1.p1 gnl/TRDRNA2_/TRDRNA2_39252_c0~~gnl/TRDRNA2_/TRDRNA2_39252_c0_seq1.p1  ORF type:complete len:384 (+),score=67.30 gnl/TRDRNA2_/TRDRNA2_39252_c0_seq1:79-1230(+)